MENKKLFVLNGILALAGLIATLLVVVYALYANQPQLVIGSNEAVLNPFLYWIFSFIIIGIIYTFLISGFFVLKPYESATANLFGGTYNGVLYQEGFYFTNPFNNLIKVKMSTRNAETSLMKITDKDGKPVDVSVIYKWRVENTYKALFSLKEFENYITTQSEALSRKTLKKYTYNEITKENNAIIEIQDVFSEEMNKYGIVIEECELSTIAYSKEIASAMLQKQQADAIIEARESIAKGTIRVIEILKEEMKVKDLTVNEKDESKMISNLAVVMMSKETTQPVINLE